MARPSFRVCNKNKSIQNIEMMMMMHIFVLQRWLKQAISESALPSQLESSNSSSYDADPVLRTPMSPVHGTSAVFVICC